MRASGLVCEDVHCACISILPGPTHRDLSMPKGKPTPIGPMRTQPIERGSIMPTQVLPLMPTVGKQRKTPQPKKPPAATSRTLRASTNSTARPHNGSDDIGPEGMRSREGLRPTRPLHEAGMRIEPPPSLACAIGTSPAATARAAGTVAGIPRVAHRTKQLVLRRRGVAELRRLRGSGVDEAGAAK